ncbi:unnamed protein product [Symbiodinium sp. CCMP2592]|nr:unnamed protein product [Symbiodinium sp. CCMP2592]
MEQDYEIETPQKKRCLEKLSPEKSRERPGLPRSSALFRAQEALPTFGGLLAELLFVEEKGGMRDLHSLLCISKTAELKLLVGIKEMRIQHERDASQVRSYAEMCDQVQALHQNSWCSSRKLRLCSTEEGDRRAATAILSLF